MKSLFKISQLRDLHTSHTLGCVGVTRTYTHTQPLTRSDGREAGALHRAIFTAHHPHSPSVGVDIDMMQEEHAGEGGSEVQDEMEDGGPDLEEDYEHRDEEVEDDD